MTVSARRAILSANQDLAEARCRDMTELKKASLDDGRDVYEMLQEIPREENGLLNHAHGLSFEEFKAWLEKQVRLSALEGVTDGWKVPSTTYWLYADGVPVGFGKLRHFLTDALRREGGHIGYAVAPLCRGKGYGKELLRLLLLEAAGLGIEKALVTIRPNNAPSLAVALSNGGVIAEQTDERVYVWLDTLRASAAEDLFLTRPSEAYLPQIKAFRDEFADCLDWLHGACRLARFEDPAEWLRYVEQCAVEEVHPEGTTPYSQFLYVRATDHKIVGMIGVRHRPVGQFETWGGHVGYCVCPSERRKGYAARMLHEVLPYCREIGLERVLLTAGDENVGSVKAILSNGGVLEGYVMSPKHHIPVGRYWIETA